MEGCRPPSWAGDLLSVLTQQRGVGLNWVELQVQKDRLLSLLARLYALKLIVAI
jgi:hypothetical protein